MMVTYMCRILLVLFVSTAASVSITQTDRYPSPPISAFITDAPIRPHVPPSSSPPLFVAPPPVHSHGKVPMDGTQTGRSFFSPMIGKQQAQVSPPLPLPRRSQVETRDSAKLPKTVLGASESLLHGEDEVTQMLIDDASSAGDLEVNGGGPVSITASGSTVTKPELASTLAASTGVNKADVIKILDVLPSTVVEYIAAGRKVNLTKLGAFGAKMRPARTARNPRTNEAVQVQEKLAPTFGFSKTMKNLLQQQHEQKPSSVSSTTAATVGSSQQSTGSSSSPTWFAHSADAVGDHALLPLQQDSSVESPDEQAGRAARVSPPAEGNGADGLAGQGSSGGRGMFSWR
eukprot:GHVS01028963.1.p1 GENE.GHVS01028963.1~~GHVS01028963.1.p1  ORF type:complete len:345 (+),score=58.55 GHVS01028963.1:138-1172(+)